MKAALKLLFITLLIFSLTPTYADCTDESSSCPDEYCSNCQCTDISCGSRGTHHCVSKRDCCEAFGNVGAR